MSQMKQLEIIRQESEKLRNNLRKANNDVSKAYDKGWMDAKDTRESCDELRILELEQESEKLRNEIAALEKKVKELEEHIETVDEFWVPDGEPTTGFADDAPPKNGYLWINGGGDWGRGRTLDEIQSRMVGNCKVFELGKQLMPVTTITWEEVE